MCCRRARNVDEATSRFRRRRRVTASSDWWLLINRTISKTTRCTTCLFCKNIPHSYSISIRQPRSKVLLNAFTAGSVYFLREKRRGDTLFAQNVTLSDILVSSEYQRYRSTIRISIDSHRYIDGNSLLNSVKVLKR